MLTYEQFSEITKELLSHHKIEEGFADIIANTVWAKSEDIRDRVKIDNIAKCIEDVNNPCYNLEYQIKTAGQKYSVAGFDIILLNTVFIYIY